VIEVDEGEAAGAKIRSGGSCRSPALRGKKLPHARRCAGIRRVRENPERAQARPVHQGRDRRAKADSGLVGRSAEVSASYEMIVFAKPNSTDSGGTRHQHATNYNPASIRKLKSGVEKPRPGLSPGGVLGTAAAENDGGRDHVKSSLTGYLRRTFLIGDENRRNTGSPQGWCFLIRTLVAGVPYLEQRGRGLLNQSLDGGPPLGQ
jgi:hypothetical protein